MADGSLFAQRSVFVARQKMWANDVRGRQLTNSEAPATGGLPQVGKRSRVRGMTLDLTDHEAFLLLKELNGIIDGDRYFLSDRINTLKAIRAKIRPEPAREPLPPPPSAMPRHARVRQRDGAAGVNGLALSLALRASEDEDNGEQRADRRQAPKDLRHSRSSSTIGNRNS
jgi:hypothetical protein